jgi:hypothetical protein
MTKGLQRPFPPDTRITQADIINLSKSAKLRFPAAPAERETRG